MKKAQSDVKYQKAAKEARIKDEEAKKAAAIAAAASDAANRE
jgi:hypothetical protein